MATYTGYLYKRRLLMGTISEGSDYRIQINNSCSIPVCKRTYPWEDDPELEARLHNYISLSGEITGKGILYESVLAAKSPPSQIESHLAN